MDRGIDDLISSRKLLKVSVAKSMALGLSIEESGYRLNEISRRLPSLEVSIRPIRAQRESLAAVSGHIDRAVVPATAVLKVFDAIHGLEKSLSDPQSDLSGYLAVLKRLEEAMKFLGDNCGMAIQWLGDIIEYLGDHMVADELFISGLKKTILHLRELESVEEKGFLDGGLLEASLGRLENEFRRLLTENGVRYPMPPSSPGNQHQACISQSPLPVGVILKLQAILGRLIPNKRLEKCVSIYIEVRSSNVRASLQALNLDYLEISSSEFNTVASIEVYISQWGKHLEFAVKHLFETEFKLCNDVFERMGLDVWKGCFSKIVAQAGFLAFLQFGKTVTEGKKDPVKLLKLLDIFASLNNLRLDFNRLFNGCDEIRNLTRDLIERVIKGASEIFWELLVQVELQRHTEPPEDCSVPRVVYFITDYCNKLLGEDYRPILIQVLGIESSWRGKSFHEKVLIVEILKLVKAIQRNLETWSGMYPGDAVAPYVFLMNNHRHLHRSVKETRLGGILGEGWLREQEQCGDYYLSAFLRESWGKLPSLLSREGLILFSGGRTAARSLVKRRLKAFNEAFDETCERQAKWVIGDKEVREATCRCITQAVVPVYRSYMQNYGALVEQEGSKYFKYTAQALENVLSSLFNPKLKTRSACSNGRTKKVN
ncbi:hypothetical protein M569_11914 [Genlisea aurea]|uniref:Exocyst subunit Exo70 family protein n=1 Tax=Genlisea aurea TaxID=192259 RepID=S8C804_9LAMI|nr:hypothetical protein M569_11914 [Genlisea aurea]